MYFEFTDEALDRLSTSCFLKIGRLRGDRDIVNCVQAAPGGFGGGLVATSGIDYDVKLWSPHGAFDPTSVFKSAREQEDCFVKNYSRASEDAERLGVQNGLNGGIDIDSLQRQLMSYYGNSENESQAAVCPVT